MDSGPPLSTEKAPAHPLRDAAEAFLLTKQLAGCTADTLRTYRWWVELFLEAGPDVGVLAVRSFFARLQERGLSASRQHQAYRTLRAFFRWCVETEVLRDTPLRGFTMRTPKTLPRVPADEDLRALIGACAGHLEGIRNRALLLVLADAGLRASESLHLLTEDWRSADRALVVRAGKGRKDRIAFVGPTTMRALRRWLARHPRPAPEAFLFCDREGRTASGISPRRVGSGVGRGLMRCGAFWGTRVSTRPCDTADLWALTWRGPIARPAGLSGWASTEGAGE